jgi:diaminohydroxyphosphoribosylaminopyrimidine deaminase/5-amino-6-(5-phosphoribosylamino)uracil reductase
MSTKKDKFSLKDKKYMKLALNLASARKGLTGDNPSVGCVIVKNDKIISIGQTGYNGRPHAEHNAIINSFQNLKGSKMYITLEPCNHYGKTPPCTKYIIKSGINEVYYSINDIDKRVKGKSLKILSKKKINVKKGLLKNDANNLYDSYIINKINKLPYVTGKIAISKNILIYNKGTKRITDKTSDKLTHYLRYKNDAIMISSKTLNIDNPKLNCRLKGYEKFSPKRIILDKNLDIKLSSYIFRSAKKVNTVIFHSSSNNSKIRILKKKGINLVKSRLNNCKHFDLKKILKKLYILGIKNLLVEGGDKITKNLLNNRLINQFYLFKSPKNLSKTKKYQIFTSMSILDNKYINKSKISSKLAKDKITIYKR